MLEHSGKDAKRDSECKAVSGASPSNAPQPAHGAIPEGSVPLTDHVQAGPGRAMTDETGVITGDLTLTLILTFTTEVGPYATPRSGSGTPAPTSGTPLPAARLRSHPKAGGRGEAPDTTS
ncbi:hypothetical protein ACFVX6_19425 [Streptomyces sp. NPDC058289]|uniref:hypothetical protein n=1 Tax=Streptomyces sp. NPDC058289 TaxID=3346425 RepID=UPI0036EE4226